MNKHSKNQTAEREKIERWSRIYAALKMAAPNATYEIRDGGVTMRASDPRGLRACMITTRRWDPVCDWLAHDNRGRSGGYVVRTDWSRDVYATVATLARWVMRGGPRPTADAS